MKDLQHVYSFISIDENDSIRMNAAEPTTRAHLQAFKRKIDYLCRLYLIDTNTYLQVLPLRK